MKSTENLTSVRIIDGLNELSDVQAETIQGGRGGSKKSKTSGARGFQPILDRVELDPTPPPPFPSRRGGPDYVTFPGF